MMIIYNICLYIFGNESTFMSEKVLPCFKSKDNSVLENYLFYCSNHNLYTCIIFVLKKVRKQKTTPKLDCLFLARGYTSCNIVVFIILFEIFFWRNCICLQTKDHLCTLSYDLYCYES